MEFKEMELTAHVTSYTNECTEGKHDCDVNAAFNNTLASYKFTCKDGYEGNRTNCTEKIWSAIICEGDKRTISCENDQRTIDVVDANYGRLDSNTCNHPAISNTNCKAENSLVIVRMKCIEEASCEFHAVHSAFGHNPCPGTFKCLEVKFKCEFGSVAIAIFAYCELGGEMALCYHLGGICFRIALGARSCVHFQSRAY
nr:L-rhamnose-binding lectin SML-like [Pocillopora verrucosa]